MTAPVAVRLLFALARAEALVRDGSPPPAALRSASHACGVDAADLSSLWYRREFARVEARRALEQPGGLARTKTTTSDDEKKN